MSACNMPRIAFPHVPALWYLGDEHLAGGALAGANRPVHIAVPDLRGLRARPVDSAHGLPERLAVASPHAGTKASSVASFPALRACLPSRKPRSTPQLRSCGELSKMTLTSSSRLKTDPESPSARQKGSG